MEFIRKKHVYFPFYLLFALCMCNSTTDPYQGEGRENLLIGQWVSEKSYNPYLRQYQYSDDPTYWDSVAFYPDHTYAHRPWGEGSWELLEHPVPYESDTSAMLAGSMDDGHFDIVELTPQSLQLRVLGRHGIDIYYFRKID